MDKEEFRLLLEEKNIDPAIVCFNDNVTDDVFCVMEFGKSVDVFYRERGKEHGLRSFPSLSCALTYLADSILQMS